MYGIINKTIFLPTYYRLYLINSPAVRADSLKFKEEGVRDILKDVFIPWMNANNFLMQNVRSYEQVVIFFHVIHRCMIDPFRLGENETFHLTTIFFKWEMSLFKWEIKPFIYVHPYIHSRLKASTSTRTRSPRPTSSTVGYSRLRRA